MHEDEDEEEEEEVVVVVVVVEYFWVFSSRDFISIFLFLNTI
jgi:hypothetical protein